MEPWSQFHTVARIPSLNSIASVDFKMHQSTKMNEFWGATLPISMRRKSIWRLDPLVITWIFIQNTPCVQIVINKGVFWIISPIPIFLDVSGDFRDQKKSGIRSNKSCTKQGGVLYKAAFWIKIQVMRRSDHSLQKTVEMLLGAPCGFLDSSGWKFGRMDQIITSIHYFAATWLWRNQNMGRVWGYDPTPSSFDSPEPFVINKLKDFLQTYDLIKALWTLFAYDLCPNRADLTQSVRNRSPRYRIPSREILTRQKSRE